MTQSEGTVLFLFWAIFTACTLAAALTALIWAVRSGQFSDQDRARYLPLLSGIPEERRAETDSEARTRGSNIPDLPFPERGDG
jgi:cbb3-type cytochrome oxidase maturation protein